MVCIAVLAGLAVGCAPKEAPIVDPNAPEQHAALIKQIENDPKMSPQQKQMYLYWQGKVGANYSAHTTAATNQKK